MFKNRIVKSESNVQIQATTKTFLLFQYFFSAIDKERERIFGVCWTHNSMLNDEKWRKNEAGKERPACRCVGAEFYIRQSSDCVYNAFSWICESNRNKRDENKADEWCACATNTTIRFEASSREPKKSCSQTPTGEKLPKILCETHERRGFWDT